MSPNDELALLSKEKQTTIDKLLGEEYVLVHLNSSMEGVDVPAQLKGNPGLVLKLSRYFRGALALEEEKIVAELLFGRSYHTCTVPFHAVWGVTSPSGKNIVWAASTPTEILEKLEKNDDPPPTSEGKRAHLRRVK